MAVKILIDYPLAPFKGEIGPFCYTRFEIPGNRPSRQSVPADGDRDR